MAEIDIELQSRMDDADASKCVVDHLNVGPDYGLDLLPYSTALRSCVAHHLVEAILDNSGAHRVGSRRLRLPDLRIAGQPLDDLDVVVSRAPSRLGVDGFLGLDFFERFDVVEWHPKSRRLRLISD